LCRSFGAHGLATRFPDLTLWPNPLQPFGLRSRPRSQPRASLEEAPGNSRGREAVVDESLRDLLKTIEADEAEMQRFRARLAPKLRRRPRFYWLAPIGVAAAVAAAFWIFLAWPRQIIFSPLGLDQVRAMATRSSPEMLEKARTLAREGKGEARWNANLLLYLAETKNRAIEYADRGLEEDPRTEFRASYLELLLDEAPISFTMA
jgi:hypothetical protein